MTKMKVVAIACLCTWFLPRYAYGDASDKRTVFTFSGPVEVPGKVLAPGSYVFKLVDNPSNRNVVQVFDKDQRHLIGTFLTIPDYRATAPDKPLITFEERPAGTPEAIKSWFYPGDPYGNEFVYPKNRAVQLAAQSHQNVPSMPTSMSSNITSAPENQNSQQVTEMKKSDLKAEEPSGDEVELADVFLLVAPTTPEPPAPRERTLVALVHDEPAPAASSSGQSQLPATASPIPALFLFGSLSLCAGLALRKGSRRVN